MTPRPSVKTFRLTSLFRREIFKVVRRRWLQLTAPKWAREKWKPRSRKYAVRVCDMDDGHLLNTIGYLRREAEAGWGSLAPSWYDDFVPFEPEPTPRPILHAMVREAKRRGLPTDKAPKWLEEQNAGFGERELARRVAINK